ncbi:MAG: TatD family hydrolase [Candidatus Eremiobacteraeota bacterium]|nr:TatD family hydrolase [Candidatus Eremiobacteraeota bacterium]
MIDTHAHIHGESFADDRADVVARAKAAGVSEIVTVGCDLADSQAALEVARDFRVFASVGIHPHEAKDAPADIAAVFEPFLADRRVVAVGETGLDYYYDHSPRDRQKQVLRDQIRVARDANFPVIFHHRDAYDDFVAILREEWKPGMRGVIHCFTGDAQQAQTYVNEFGLFLGIGGVLTFNSAESVREAVRTVGVAPLVLETDCPYLTPMPHRGKRNEPMYIPIIAQKVADVLGTTVEDIAKTTDANARKLFTLSQDKRA